VGSPSGGGGAGSGAPKVRGGCLACFAMPKWLVPPKPGTIHFWGMSLGIPIEADPAKQKVSRRDRNVENSPQAPIHAWLIWKHNSPPTHWSIPEPRFFGEESCPFCL